MRKTTKLIGSGSLTVFCLALGTSLNAGPLSSPPTVKSSPPSDTNIVVAAPQPAEFNKASGIVGMPVSNQSDERLGRIKDVVFDLKTERVAYAVLAIADQPEKLVTVPLSAFSPSADGSRLILRTDAAKLKAAQGLTANNWPGVTSPAWGAQTASANDWENAPYRRALNSRR